jgi:serine/threonine protein kinase
VAAQASSSPHTLQSQPSYVNEFSIDLSELRLGKVIGQGGNGRIFQAQYAGSAVAVKELFASTSGQDGSTTVDVLFREFNSLRVLKHPHIIQIFGLAVARSVARPSKAREGH